MEKYIETQIKKPTKEGIRIISEMSTVKILSYVTYRHRVGLLLASTVFMAAYVAYDKVVRLFV